MTLSLRLSIIAVVFTMTVLLYKHLRFASAWACTNSCFRYQDPSNWLCCTGNPSFITPAFRCTIRNFRVRLVCILGTGNEKRLKQIQTASFSRSFRYLRTR